MIFRFRGEKLTILSFTEQKSTEKDLTAPSRQTRLHCHVTACGFPLCPQNWRTSVDASTTKDKESVAPSARTQPVHDDDKDGNNILGGGRGASMCPRRDEAKREIVNHGDLALGVPDSYLHRLLLLLHMPPIGMSNSV